jgi:hypothetical protein
MAVGPEPVEQMAPHITGIRRTISISKNMKVDISILLYKILLYKAVKN